MLPVLLKKPILLASSRRSTLHCCHGCNMVQTRSSSARAATSGRVEAKQGNQSNIELRWAYVQGKGAGAWAWASSLFAWLAMQPH